MAERKRLRPLRTARAPSWPITRWVPSRAAVTEETVSLDPGTYTITLGDDWGDGWSWAPATEKTPLSSPRCFRFLDFLTAVRLHEFTVTGGGGGPDDCLPRRELRRGPEPRALGYATSEYSDDCDTDPALSITYSDGPRDYACGERREPHVHPDVDGYGHRPVRQQRSASCDQPLRPSTIP